VGIFAELHKAQPQNARLAALLANAHLANGEPHAAAEALKKADLQSPIRAAYLKLIDAVWADANKARSLGNTLNEAALYADAGWLTLAETRYRELLKDYPDNLALLALALDAEERLGHDVDAIAICQRMLKQKTDFEPILRKLARHHVTRDEHEQAVNAFRRLLVQKPDAFDIKLALATSLCRVGKTPDAIKLYTEIIKELPKHPSAYNNLAWIYVSNPDHIDLAEAERLAVVALELTRPGSARRAAVCDTLAWIYYQAKRYERAVEYGRQAVAGLPGSTEARYHLGMIYLELDQRASAARELTQALALDPTPPQKAEIAAAIDRIRGRKP
jgi:tetratricopeptide (TPR) repeat protein